MTPSIQATTAQFPGYTFEEACERIAEGVTEGFGRVHQPITIQVQMATPALFFE